MKRSMRSGWMILMIFSMVLGNVSEGHAQRQRSSNPMTLSVSGYMGKFNVHDKVLSRYNGTHPYGVDFEIGRLLMGKDMREQFGTIVKYGLALSYVDFDHEDLGFGLAAMGYFEPFVVMHRHWRFSVKMGTGLAYMSNPYDENSNPMNLAYSTSLSMPLTGGLGIYYFINNHLAVKAIGAIQHVSNGGFKHPNLGINYPTIAVGLEFIGDNYTIPPQVKLPPSQYENVLSGHLGYSLTEDSATMKKVNVINAMVLYSWQVTRINALTAGAIVEYQQLPEPFSKSDRWSAAPMVGNEFIFGKVLFGQQLGIYAVKGGAAPNTVFQNYYLRYRIKPKIMGGVDLKTHGRVADYLAVQVGYCF